MTADILRLVAGGLLALVCCYAGVLIKRHYADREKFYTDAEAFAAYVSSELGFRKTTLPVLIAGFSEGKKGAFPEMLGRFTGALSLAGGQQGAAVSAADSLKLKPDEKKEMKEFLSALGRTALDDQLSSASHWKEVFAAKRSKCAEETKRLGGMYFKLAVLLGIALIVLVA